MHYPSDEYLIDLNRLQANYPKGLKIFTIGIMSVIQHSTLTCAKETLLWSQNPSSYTLHGFLEPENR